VKLLHVKHRFECKSVPVMCVCVSVCRRPIDLLTVKKNIELGVTRTTAEFQRDVMLMFVNSIMYNKSSHFVHKMAQQMQQEGLQHVQVSQHYLHNHIMSGNSC